jgi:hypothetical protein
MSVEPKSDATTRAEIASLDRMRNVSVGLQGARPFGRILRKSFVRTVADVWKVTERRLAEKRRSIQEPSVGELFGCYRVVRGRRDRDEIDQRVFGTRAFI